MSLRALVFALVAGTALGGCATMAKIEPGPVTLKGRFTVDITEGWNQLVLGGMPSPTAIPGADEVWTSEGITLDVLAFYVGVAEGQALGDASVQASTGIPVFRAGMSPHEIVELFEAHVTRNGSDFRLTRLAPAAFGEMRGFRLDFDYTRRADDLTMRGAAYAAVVEDKLYLMTYTAPKSYFFARHIGSVEAVAASARIAAVPAAGAQKVQGHIQTTECWRGSNWVLPQCRQSR